MTECLTVFTVGWHHFCSSSVCFEWLQMQTDCLWLMFPALVAWEQWWDGPVGGQPALLTVWTPLSSLLRTGCRYNKALGDTDADGGGEQPSRSRSAAISLQLTPTSSTILVYIQLTPPPQEEEYCLPPLSGPEKIWGGDESVNSDA